MSLLFIVGVLFVATLGFVVAFGAPYVPSKRSDLRTAFDELYRLSAKDTVVDLGSGDGLVLREVSKRGAKAIGVELNPLLVALSRWLSRNDPRVSVLQGNLWNMEFPASTSVVYVFGESRDIKKLERKMVSEATRLNKTLVVISYGFELHGVKHEAKAGAHFKYTLEPLQGGQP